MLYCQKAVAEPGECLGKTPQKPLAKPLQKPFANLYGKSSKNMLADDPRKQVQINERTLEGALNDDTNDIMKEMCAFIILIYITHDITLLYY